MGLDNYPATYPCKKESTAVLDDEGRIDCESTRECGGCTWYNDLGNEPGAVLGIFGTDCWYRGKWGNHLMSELGVDSSYFGNFYDDELLDGLPLKSSMSCLGSALLMEEALTKRKQRVEVTEEFENQVTYAVKWLRWVAEKGEGAIVW